MSNFKPVSDPFRGKGPIMAGQPGFYPRAELLTAVQDSLRAGDSVSVVGERQAGKTSFLHYLLINLSPDEFIPVYVDGQSVAPKQDRLFLRKLVQEAAGSVAQTVGLDEAGQAQDTLDVQIRLFELLQAHFNLSELQTLCFYLGVDYENLAGTTKEDKARELVLRMQRYGRFPHFLQTLQRLRSDVELPTLPPAPAISQTLPETNTLHASADEAYTTFQEDLETLRQLLPVQPDGQKRKLVWLIDEIEILRAYENTELFAFLRPFVQSDPDFRFVVAGYDVLYTLSTRSEWSPFYNAFQPVRLDGLTPDIATALIERALRQANLTMADDFYETILHWAGQKPFYLKWLFSEIAKAINQRQQGYDIDLDIWDNSRELFFQEAMITFHFSHLWETHTSSSQQVILSWLAQNSPPYTHAAVLTAIRQQNLLPPPSQSLSALIEDLTRLKQLGFLYERTGSYTFTSGCLQAWIADNKPL